MPSSLRCASTPLTPMEAGCCCLACFVAVGPGVCVALSARDGFVGESPGVCGCCPAGLAGTVRDVCVGLPACAAGVLGAPASLLAAAPCGLLLRAAFRAASLRAATAFASASASAFALAAGSSHCSGLSPGGVPGGVGFDLRTRTGLSSVVALTLKATLTGALCQPDAAGRAKALGRPQQLALYKWHEFILCQRAMSASQGCAGNELTAGSRSTANMRGDSAGPRGTCVTWQFCGAGRRQRAARERAAGP